MQTKQAGISVPLHFGHFFWTISFDSNGLGGLFKWFIDINLQNTSYVSVLLSASET